jgi:uroporphyrin-III C-methyltransferase/precorrin-2 dehydrogenase/sirohydrochlorin ferrochelatase
MQYFPINIRCADANIAVIGGDADAVAKIRLLLKTDAHITVFAEQAEPDIRAWHAAGKLSHCPRVPDLHDLATVTLAYVSGADTAIRDAAMQLLDKRNIPFCVIDDLARSRFITPANVDRDPVTIAIGTEGKAPVLARRIKAMIEQELPQHTGMLAEISGRFRHYLTQYSGAFRRRFWGVIFDDIAPSVVNAGGNTVAQNLETAMHDLLDQMSPVIDLSVSDTNISPPPVAFVSAGPGDPDLLTVKARRYLDTAEVVLHDHLISPAILELARREAVLINTDKTGYGTALAKSDINELLISHGKSGARVVRLKSGDASAAGCLDNELAACRLAGLDYMVIPGIAATSDHEDTARFSHPISTYQERVSA